MAVRSVVMPGPPVPPDAVELPAAGVCCWPGSTRCSSACADRPTGFVWSRSGSSAVGAVTPVAARPMSYWLAFSRSNSATISPCRITMIRSQAPISSGMSEEISRIARPCSANSETMRCTSALAWMSMPWVGSSRMSSRGLVASHLASTTFCWLPPDRVPIGWSKRANLSFIRSSDVDTRASSSLRRTMPSLVALVITGRVALSRIEKSSMTLCPAAVLGDVGDAVRHGVGGRSGADRLVAEGQRTGGGLVDAEDDPGDLGAAAADQAGQADHLTGPDGEPDV